MPADGTQLAWRRSSFCANGECLEVAREGSQVVVRDTKDPGGPAHRYTEVQWKALIETIKAGKFGS
jgi:Domain of unknown function (DUF397)